MGSEFSLVTVPVAAERLDMSCEAIRRAVRSGRLDATKVGGRWRVDLTQLSERARREAEDRREKSA
jgi:excisionase family DNA binding protein